MRSMSVIDRLPPRRWSYALAFILCAALIGYALYLQYARHLDPCPLCIFQRIVIIAMGAVFLIAAVHGPDRGGAKVYAVLETLIGGVGMGLALRHIWIQAQPAGSVPGCGMGLDYMLESYPVGEVIQKVLHGSGECAEVNRVMGLSIPIWTLLLFIALIVWSVALIRREPQPD